MTTVLRELNLNNNFLHLPGCKLVVEALIENHSLKRLHLASNFLKCEGADFLTFYLGLPTCILEEIDLQDNFIGEKGGFSLFEVLDPSTKTEAEMRVQN